MNDEKFIIPKNMIDVNSLHASIKKKLNDDEYQFEIEPHWKKEYLSLCTSGYRKNDILIWQIAMKDTPFALDKNAQEDNEKCNFQVSENTDDLIYDEVEKRFD